MNIQSIFYKHKPGGLNKRLYMLYAALARDRHRVHHIGAQPLPVAGGGITQHILSIPGMKKESLLFWLGFTPAVLIRSLAVAARHSVGFIFTFSPFYTLLAALPILVRRIPAATFVRADNQRHSRSGVRSRFFYCVDRAGIRLSRQVLFVSHSLKETYRIRYRIPESKLHVLPNHIERTFRIDSAEKRRLREALGVGPADFLLVTTGVLQPDKNFDYLIEALALCASPGMRLLIVGDETRVAGEMRRLKELARKRRVAGRVIFSGWLDDPRPYLAAADLFVFPSRHEGSPNSLLEALACGIPCLGSSVAEIREVLEHEALLFPLDDPRALCECIRAASAQPDHYALLQRLSRRQAQKFRFDWGRAFARIVGLEPETGAALNNRRSVSPRP
jgi:glycosyltransferase involved in cell wall biosynthesis